MTDTTADDRVTVDSFRVLPEAEAAKLHLEAAERAAALLGELRARWRESAEIPEGSDSLVTQARDQSRLTSSATGTPDRNFFTSSSGSYSTPMGFRSNASECIHAWPSSADSKLSICSSTRLPSGSR